MGVTGRALNYALRVQSGANVGIEGFSTAPPRTYALTSNSVADWETWKPNIGGARYRLHPLE